jgi:anti-sigma factor RsiW
MSHQQHISQSGQNGQDQNVLSDELLMAYAEGKLNAEETRKVEKMLSEESAEADAIEGIKMLHPTDAKRSVAELQRRLYKDLLRQHPKGKKKFSEDYWSWLAIFVILLLMVVGYIVIHIASK